MNPNLSTIGKRLRHRMIDLDMNARELGKLTGYAPSTIGRWISDECIPTLLAARQLSRHLQISMEWITDGEASA